MGLTLYDTIISRQSVPFNAIFMVFNCFEKAKTDEEMKFHANQGLWLFILEVIGIICNIMDGFMICILLLCVSVFFSVKCVGAITKGKRYEIPILGKIKLIK